MNEYEVLAKAIGAVFENDSRAWSEGKAKELIDFLFEEGFYIVPTDWGDEMFRLVYDAEAAVKDVHAKLQERFTDPE